MKRKWLRRTVLTGLIVGLLAAPLTRVSVIGIETGYPTGCKAGSWGNFVGGERGQINGFWAAQVCHTGLSVFSSAHVLPGGDLHLSRLRGGGRSGGYFLSGAIGVGSEHDLQVNGTGGCLQIYDLQGLQTTSGLTFDATLTHYGVFYGGRCHIFFAVLVGSDRTMPTHT